MSESQVAARASTGPSGRVQFENFAARLVAGTLVKQGVPFVIIYQEETAGFDSNRHPFAYCQLAVRQAGLICLLWLSVWPLPHLPARPGSTQCQPRRNKCMTVGFLLPVRWLAPQCTTLFIFCLTSAWWAKQAPVQRQLHASSTAPNSWFLSCVVK